jgi:hypothetical protein
MDILQHLVSVGKIAEQTEDVADDAHIVVVVEVEEDVLMLLDCTDRVATDFEMQVVELALFPLIASCLLVGVQLRLVSLLNK